MQRPLIKNIFQQYYKIHTSNDGAVQTKIKPVQLNNLNKAQHFIKQLNVNRHYWQSLLQELGDSSLNKPGTLINLEEKVAKLVQFGRIVFYPVNRPSAAKNSSIPIQAKKSKGVNFEFIDPSFLLTSLSLVSKQSFSDKLQAMQFIYDANISNTDAVTLLKNHAVSAVENHAISILAGLLVDEKIAVIKQKISKPITANTPVELPPKTSDSYAGLGTSSTAAATTAMAETAPSEAPKIDIKTKVEVEFKVVPYDRKLSKYQPANATKIKPDAVYIKLSMSSSADPYDKGAKLTCTPENVAFYKDEKLTEKFNTNSVIPKDKLNNGASFKLYMTSKSKGKFELKLIPEKSSDSRFNIVKIGKEKLACVEFELKIHQHDVAAINSITVDPDTDPISKYYDDLRAVTLPDQVVLSDKDKIKVGRLLHVQKDGNAGRAKIIIPKLDNATWPEGCDDYTLTLDKASHSGSGNFEIYDKEFKGSKQSLPLTMKKTELANQEKVLWLQGSIDTAKSGDLQVRLNLDRAAGGLAKTPKQNCDWVSLTVVKINKVNIEDRNLAGGINAWDEANERFFINHLSDPDGRIVTITVKLNKAIEGIPIYMMLSEDKDNRKKANWGEDLPASWKWKDIKSDYKHKDKPDRKKLLHISGKTDSNGIAQCKLTLSRFGGDVFTPSAYLEQDPHLALYVDEQATLKDKKPVFSTKRIKVWRKFWYQMTQPDGLNAPIPNLSQNSYIKVKTKMLLDNNITFTKANAPANTFYKRYILAGGNSDDEVAVIGSHNKNELAKKFASNPSTPLKNHLIVCEYQYDEASDNVDDSRTLIASPPDNKILINFTSPVLDPPLQGGNMVVEATWEQKGIKHNINPANIIIPKPRSSSGSIEISLPTEVIPTSAEPVKIYLECQCADGPYLGESFGLNSLIVYDATNVPDYNDTITHEIGHAFEQTSHAATLPTTIPAHPNTYYKQGDHCNYGSKKCVMYESGPQSSAIHEYCEICHPYVLIQDMTKFQKA